MPTITAETAEAQALLRGTGVPDEVGRPFKPPKQPLTQG
jgi:hypothetical protein